MKKLICEKIIRIIKGKQKLEEELNVKLTIRGKEVEIEGEPEDEYIAEKVIDALDFGFPFSAVMMIKEEDTVFEILNIKDYTRRKDMEIIKARIIGKGGGTLAVLSELTKCFFEIKDNRVGIIGLADHIKNAQDAMIYLINGSKQSNVYTFLEKHQPRPIVDLGLKEPKKKK
jgi:KH domain-containing protein